MDKRSRVALMCLLVGLVIGFGCSSSGDDGNGGTGPAGPSPGSYAGTWRGNVCGRGLTMTLTQNNRSLSGRYTLTDPQFEEGLSGTVSSTTPPASAVLNGGADRRFELQFSSYTAFSGGYFKGASKVCDVRATK